MEELYYTPEALAVLKANTKCSSHTWRLIMNPVHAYTCTGEDCVRETNKEDQ